MNPLFRMNRDNTHESVSASHQVEGHGGFRCPLPFQQTAAIGLEASFRHPVGDDAGDLEIILLQHHEVAVPVNPNVG